TAACRRHDHRTKADIWHKMSVHDVAMDPFHTMCFQIVQLLTETCVIGRQDGWCDDWFTWLEIHLLNRVESGGRTLMGRPSSCSSAFRGLERIRSMRLPSWRLSTSSGLMEST